MAPMHLTREMKATVEPLQPAEGCVEFPLLLLDEQLAELEQKSRSAQRTIGQMIRQAIGLYLSGVRERDFADGTWSVSQLDMPSEGALAVTLLLPISQLAELEALAARYDTTASALIRRVVCCFLLERASGQQRPNES